jgi:hypothetical protein
MKFLKSFNLYEESMNNSDFYYEKISEEELESISNSYFIDIDERVFNLVKTTESYD